MRPVFLCALVVVVAVVAPAVAVAQGRVVVEKGLPGPELEPDQAILFVKGAETVTMAVQPRFRVAGSGARFAVLLATPEAPLYGTDRPTLFEELALAAAPRIEEVVHEVQDPRLGEQCQIDNGGCSGGPPQQGGPDWPTPEVPDGAIEDAAPEVIAVGPYEVLRLSAGDTAELSAWLDQFGYLYTQEDVDAIAPYLARGDVITAVRVIVEDPGTSALEVLTLSWSATELRMPLALGRPPAGQTTRLAVYVSAIGRHDVAFATPRFAGRRPDFSGDFLTVTEVPITSATSIDDDPVARPIEGNPEIRAVEYVDVIVRIPVNDCSLVEDDLGCCGTGRRRVRWDAIVVALAIVLTLRRRRAVR